MPLSRERESTVPSTPRGKVEGVGDTLPRDEDGVGEVRWRLRSPFLRAAALEDLMRFLDAEAEA